MSYNASSNTDKRKRNIDKKCRKFYLFGYKVACFIHMMKTLPVPGFSCGSKLPQQGEESYSCFPLLLAGRLTSQSLKLVELVKDIS